MTTGRATSMWHRAGRVVTDRRGLMGDLAQTAIVAVLGVTLIIGIIGATLVATVVQSIPLQQANAVSVYAHRALQAGENAYVTAINANPSLAQCNTGTTGGLCGNFKYGSWNLVTGSNSTDGYAEYYAFGNPQPTFDPTTKALTSLSVQVVGAAHDPNTKTNYVFDSENINLAADNGFLTNVWWSNYESYSPNADYSNCNYNWKLNYNVDNNNAITCSAQVYFGPNDYLFGPVYTNDSVFVSGNGSASGSPSFGNGASSPKVPSAVTTADPHCQFVDDANGMSGSYSNCSSANGEVALYDTTNSSYGNPVESPPQSDAQLQQVAEYYGCLYSGPTQIQLNPNGTMTVTSPDTPESGGLDGNNIPTNTNSCPNDGVTQAPIPTNGVVFVENVPNGQTVVKGANPLDGYLDNTVTNLASNPSPAPVAGQPVTLTATVTSAQKQISAGATVAFKATTSSGTSTIGACSSVSNWSAPTPSGSNWTETATCTTTAPNNTTGSYSATYSGGTFTTSSQANLGTPNTLSPTKTYGANSQTNAGGCSACYYGESSTPDSEGDAFVSGALSGQLTIGTQNNVVITGNITYQDCSTRWTVGQSLEANSLCPYVVGATNDSLGLIANDYVEVNHPVTNANGSVLGGCTASSGILCDPSVAGSGLTIDAAVLALTQSFVVNNYQSGSDEGQLKVYGSIQQFARGPVGTFSGSSTVSGYVKHYTWNPLLGLLSPPSYLVPSTAPWTLTSVNSNGGERTTANCPDLIGIYNGYPTTAATPPAPINQYCSQSTGGLPGYPALAAPSPPTNVTATASIGGTATVSWTDPANNGSPVTRYDVQASPPCPACTGLSAISASATSTPITGLTPGIGYVFTVTATNAQGTSDPSAPSPSVTSPTVPYAPTLVTAVGNVNDTVSVNWTDPSSVGSPISQYTVTASPACPGCTGGVVVNPTATSATIAGLTVGGTYTFTVTATNGLGTGPSSLPSNPVVVPTRPGAPTGVSATSYANTQSTVSWNAPASSGGLPITGYTVTSSPGAKTCTTSGVTSCTVSGLTNGTAYTFTVTATNAIGTGPASAASPAATPSTLPGAPTIGTATNGVDSASVTFAAPASNGGAPITSYTVTASPGGITATCASSPCVVTGLSAGTVYSFKVTATNGSGTGPSSGSSNSITATGPPGAPTAVSATSYANGQSVVSWAAPYNGGSAITSYTVTSSGGQTCTTASTSCTVTGLTNGTTYTFTVTATNVLGVGPASSPASGTPGTVPSAPVMGSATGGYQSATVTWAAPASNGGLPISGYTVTSSPGGVTCSTSGTSCTVTGLTNGTSYTFKVTATNAAGVGAASAASNPVTPANAAPGAPSNVNASSFANAQSVVSWTAAAANGSAVTAYNVTASPGGRTCSTASTSCTVTGLTNGTAYTFTVTATNGIGTGPASAPSAAATPSTVPGAPTAVSATSFANTQSTVSWTAPASSGGNPITSSTVTSSPGGKTCTTPDGVTTSCTVTGLTNGTSYTFTVTATNGSGTGPASAASAAAVPATVPGAPTGVNATSNGNGQSTVTWNAPGATGGTPITSYTVTSSQGDTCTTPNGSTRTCTVTGLNNGTTYTFTVAATNNAGTGPSSAPSSPITPATLPGAPTGVSAQGSLDSSSIVSWTPPASNGGSAITKYTVTASTGQTCTTPDGVTTSCTVNGLTNGLSYTFTVTATNALGTGPASSVSNSIVPAATPGAPTGVTATSNSDSRSLVSWTAPVSTGGSPITSYTVTANSGQTCVTANGSTTSCTLLGLSNGTTYTFTVVATNSIGSGPSSASATATPSTVPNAPTGVTATSYANTRSVVSWTAPAFNGGAPITAYTVTSSPGGYTCATTGATTCTVNGLTNGTPYTFTVTATNVSGTGPASAPSTSATPATLPGAATNVSATSYANTQSVVSWTAPASNGGAPITNYTVTSSPGGYTCSTVATYCTVAGLTNGSPYTFTVVATNAVGAGPVSAASAAATPATVPGAPTGAVATATNSATTALVSWTAPTVNGGAPVTGYTVTSTPGNYTCSTSATNCTFSGLVTGTTYTFTVTAANGAGSGAASSASNSLRVGTPGAPTGVTATSYANAQSVVAWTAPSANGGSSIATYTVTSSPGSFTCATASTTCTVNGLTNGVSYTFSVTATNATGAGAASIPSAAAIPATVPSVPTAVTATSYSNAQSAISWTTPASNGGVAITGYTVTSTPGNLTCAAASNGCTVTGLTNGTPYTFTVTATNAAGTSAASAASAPATPATVPGLPTGVAATSYANSQSVVSWTAPVSNGGAAITSYTATSSPGGYVCSSSSTSCTVTGLTNGTPYTFTVTATNPAGTGTTSAASAPATPATSPGAPTSVNATSYANTQSLVSWNAPASTGGAAITLYTVTSSPGSKTCTSTTTSCTVTGLTNGTSYTFTVTAANPAGTSVASAPSAAAVPATVPGAPTGVTATSNANTQSAVSWTAPGSNGGAPILSYTVTSSPGNLTCTTGGLGCTVTGLTNGSSYTFTVTATNAAGTSASSSPSAAVVPATAPGAPTGVTATSNANSSSLVSWTAPASNGGAAISSYTVTSSPGNLTCSTPSTSCTVSGLTNGTPYTFTVTATNAAGTSSASAVSASATPATAPGAPTAVTATSYANSQSVVSWTPPVSNGGAPITGYTVVSSPGSFTCTGASTNCVVAGLTNGTSYTFTVTATNAAGTSGPSAPSAAAVPATTPGVPTAVVATSNANAQSAVSWTAPSSNGGAAITSYTVLSSPGNYTCSTSTTGCTVSGLANGTSYTFTVTATNPAGTSGASTPSAAATPATTAAAPTAVSAGPTTIATSATVSWTASASNGGSSISSYLVTSSTGGKTCSTPNGSTTTCTVLGLTTGTNYSFTVVAVNGAGNSPSSSASNTLLVGTPGAPTGVSATSNANAQSVVSWTAPVANAGGVTSYTVTSSPGGFTCTTASTSCTVTGLTNGTSYTFTVTASTGTGAGPASLASGPAVPATTPGTPGIGSVSYVTGIPNGSAAQVVVHWTDPGTGGSPITSYNVTSSPAGGTCSASSGSATTCTVASGLTPGTPYTFTVTATNALGTGAASAASASVTPLTAPSTPASVTATIVSNIANTATPQMTVSWPASSSGGATPTYVVTSSPGTGTCSTTSTSCVISSGLTAGTPYTFTVVASNAAGSSSTSTPSSSVTAATVPGAPTIGTAVGGSAATVSWTAPSSTGGSAITGYTVTSSTGGKTCTSATSPCTVTGLTVGTAYTFTVTATNADGTGLASAASNSSGSIVAPIALVEQAATSGTGVTTLTPTLPAGGVVSGDTLIVVVSDTHSGGALVSGTGVSGPTGAGVTWAKVVGQNGTSGNGDTEIWYGKVTTTETASNAVTVTMTGSTNVQLASVSEWSGILTTASPLEAGTGGGASNNTTFTAGPISTSLTGDLVLSSAWTAAAGYTSGTSGLGVNSTTAGFTALWGSILGGNYEGWAAYDVVGAPGTSAYSASWNQPGSAANYATAIAAFKP